MQYVRMLLLLGVTAVVLAATPVSASADTVTGPNGETTPSLHEVSDGHTLIYVPITTVLQCQSTKVKTVVKHPAGGDVEWGVSGTTFGPCTNSWHVTVKTTGTEAISTAGGGTGTVVSNGMTIEATRFLVPCNYATNNTTIGTFTDSTVAANKLGTLDIKAEIPLHSGSSELCGTGKAKWEGTYSSTTKVTLDNN